MAATTYDEALSRLLRDEGGYSNHPDDPGGPTNFGITLADYRRCINREATADDVKRMSVGQAKAIYRAKYWDAQKCDQLPAGVDYSIFDYGVNSGIGRSGKVLRRVLGLPDNTSVVTAEVIEAAAKRDPKALVVAINDERLRFLHGLRTWSVFGKGWGRRVASVRARSYELASGARPQAPSGVSTPVAGKGAVPVPKKAKAAVNAGGAGAGLSLAAGVHWIGAHPFWTGVMLIAAGVAVATGLYALRRWQDAKQEAPVPNTPVVQASAG